MNKLTRSAILSMSSDELRLAVAKVMGWRWIAPIYARGRRMLVPGNVAESYLPEFVFADPGDKPPLPPHNDCPDYPNDIAAAWQVVEAMHQRQCHLLKLRYSGEWEAAFAGPYCGDSGLEPYGFADGCATAMEAICRAALLAMEDTRE